MESSRIEELEKRVAALEQSMAQIMLPPANGIVWKDWRQAVGKFRPTELSEEVDKAGREIREADRREANS